MLDATPHTPASDLRVPLFSLTGLRDGPRLVVTGPDALVRAVADLLWDQPQLAMMRGSLVVRPDGQDPLFDLPDDTLTLEGTAEAARFAYFRVLGRMTALGMITGRSVPRRWVA